MSQFAAATALMPAGQRRFRAEVPPGWDIAGAVNGGYLLALAARALAETTGRPDPISVTGHFLAPVAEGMVDVEVAPIRQGRRLATAAATISTSDRTAVTVLGTLADLSTPQPAATAVAAAPPDLPPPDECVLVEPTDTFPPPFMGRIELRLPPETRFGEGDDAHVRGWFRLLDGEPIDTIALLCAADAFPPAIFFTGLPIAWVPTIELTVHVRRRPVPGWLRCRFDTRFVADGFLEEDGEIWDDSGQLVAQSRQLALVPRD